MQLPFPSTKTHPLFQIHNINIDEGMEARSNSHFIRLCDDVVVEDRDDTIPIMLEMDNNYLIQSDNIDTQRLHIKVNLGVVSTVYPRDRTVTGLLHNRPNIDELTANIAPPGWISSTSPVHLARTLQRAADQAR